jgi:hypothetical protein
MSNIEIPSVFIDEVMRKRSSKVFRSKSITDFSESVNKSDQLRPIRKNVYLPIQFESIIAMKLKPKTRAEMKQKTERVLLDKHLALSKKFADALILAKTMS